KFLFVLIEIHGPKSIPAKRPVSEELVEQPIHLVAESSQRMHASLSHLVSALGIVSLPRGQIKHKIPPSVNLQELAKFVVPASADAKWKSAYVQAGLIDSIGKTTRLKSSTTNPRLLVPLHRDLSRLDRGRFGQVHGQDALFQFGADLLGVDAFAQRENPVEIPDFVFVQKGIRRMAARIAAAVQDQFAVL